MGILLFSYLTGGFSFWVREVKVTLDFNTRGTLRGYWSPEMANNPHSITCAVYHLVPISAPMVLTACYYQPKLLDSRPPWKKSRGWPSGVVMSVGMTIVCLTQLRCTLYYNPKNHNVSIHLFTPFVVLCRNGKSLSFCSNVTEFSDKLMFIICSLDFNWSSLRLYFIAILMFS